MISIIYIICIINRYIYWLQILNFLFNVPFELQHISVIVKIVNANNFIKKKLKQEHTW